MELIVSDIEAKENEILPIKFTNYEDLKKEIVSKMQEYKTMKVTEDGIKEAKEYRANLNKFKKAIADQRIAKNKEIEEKIGLLKYNEECKELEKCVSDASVFLDNQIKQFEEIEKQEKQQQILTIWIENAGEFQELIDIDLIFNDSWLNKTYTLKKVETDMKHIVDKAKMDLQTIDTQISDEVINKQVKDFYFKNINNATVLSLSLQEGARIVESNKRIEELQNSQNLTKSTVEITNSTQNITNVQENITKSEELERLDFWIEVTPSQKSALMNFMKSNNIKAKHGITEQDVLCIVENIDTYVQDCRENGETDLRDILCYTQGIIESISTDGTREVVKYIKNESEEK